MLFQRAERLGGVEETTVSRVNFIERSSSVLVFVLAMLGLLATCGSTQAQSPTEPPSFGEALQPYGSFDGGAIDSINLATNSLNVRIPLFSFPQRGPDLHANFSIIYKNTQYNTSTTNRVNTYSLSPESGIQIISDIAPYYYHSTANLTTYGSVAEFDGTTHPLEGGTQFTGVTVV